MEPLLRQTLGYMKLTTFAAKVRDQRQIIGSEEDARVLKKAISAFTALSHVQILRVLDRDDEAILSVIRQDEGMQRVVRIEWAPACLHSTKTIGAALVASGSPISRFSSPMLNPQSAVILAGHPTRAFSDLAARLTCLELHFEDGNDLDTRMQELSAAFGTVFTAAINMEAVHVGFPSHRPLALPLESIFHNVRWKKLVAFGVQGWKLDAGEILDLALRHRDRLKGLRLRDVLLKEGSMWKNVLGSLRDGMHRLDWVSLRRIGYAKYFDEYWANAGMEVPDDPPGGVSDSDDDSIDLYEPDHDQVNDDIAGSDFSGDATDSERGDSDDEHGPQAHEMDFPPLNSPDTPSSVPWCNCSGRNYPESVEDLGDDGVFVENAKRKLWEQWVMRRCPEHSPRG